MGLVFLNSPSFAQFLTLLEFHGVEKPDLWQFLLSTPSSQSPVMVKPLAKANQELELDINRD